MLRSHDMNFVMGLAQTAAGQVSLGHLALEKSGRSDVRDFAKSIVNEYTAIETQLQAIAARMHATLAHEIPANYLALRNKLQKLSGHSFDRTYMKAAIKEYARQVKMSKAEIKRGKDPFVQKFASDCLSVFEGQLNRARPLSRAVSGKPPRASETGRTP